MNKEWLIEKVDLQAVETENWPSHQRHPFGAIAHKWQELKDKLIDGDELWEFTTPLEHWQNRHGRGGYCIVRDGEVIFELVQVMN